FGRSDEPRRSAGSDELRLRDEPAGRERHSCRSPPDEIAPRRLGGVVRLLEGLVRWHFRAMWKIWASMSMRSASAMLMNASDGYAPMARRSSLARQEGSPNLPIRILLRTGLMSARRYRTTSRCWSLAGGLPA